MRIESKGEVLSSRVYDWLRHNGWPLDPSALSVDFHDIVDGYQGVLEQLEDIPGPEESYDKERGITILGDLEGDLEHIHHHLRHAISQLRDVSSYYDESNEVAPHEQENADPANAITRWLQANQWPLRAPALATYMTTMEESCEEVKSFVNSVNEAIVDHDKQSILQALDILRWNLFYGMYQPVGHVISLLDDITNHYERR